MKTLLLVVLFIMTIVLSKKLWFENFNSYTLTEASGLEEKEVEVIERNIIEPYKTLLNFGKRNHTVIYKGEKLWQESIPYISEALSSKDVIASEISQEEYKELLDKKSIVFHFPQKLTTYILAKSLGVEKANYITEDIQRFEHIYLYLLRGEQFLILDYEDKYYKISNFTIDTSKILAELKEVETSGRQDESEETDYTNYHALSTTMDIDSVLYIPYNMVEKYPYILVNEPFGKDMLKISRDYSEKFFNRDIDYIKEVREDNGAILHIYDQEVLKYSKDGVIEYFNPLQEKTQEKNLMLSLNKASQFLQKHIDKSEKIYLSEYQDIKYKGDSKGYRFIFRYNIEGLELLDIEDRNNYIYIDVYNNNVQGFKKRIDRNLHREYTDKEAISGFELINNKENYDIFRADYERDHGVSNLSDEDITDNIYENFIDISLYYVNDFEKGLEVLKPVWLISSREYEYIFDLYSGGLIQKNLLK